MSAAGRLIRCWQSAAVFPLVVWAADAAVAAGPPPGVASPVSLAIADAPARPSLAQSPAPPVAADDVRRGNLERELQALQTQVGAQEASLVELRARLHRVESEH
ncbi:MAG: hypothetical protein FGM55_09985, partial [Rhodoferax sp.]|nr:hypothetical protein [Rhodoferax sp.]